MSSEKVKVAVLLATYNGERYIQEFLDSLCLQSHSNLRLYVRDDGSRDLTREIVASYKDKLDIAVIDGGMQLGPAASFFQILEQSCDTHPLYLFADQDDWWYPEKIERALAAIDGKYNEVLLYCSRLEYVSEELQHIGFSPVPRILTFENAVVENIATGCTVAFTNRVRLEVLSGNPRGFVMHDWWLYLYCSAVGKVLYDPKASIKYRQHAGNAIGAATTALEDFRRRWRRFVRRDGGVHRLSAQAEAFLACYGDRLSQPHKVILAKLLAGKKGIFGGLRLAIWAPVERQSFSDTFVMRILFLLRRY